MANVPQRIYEHITKSDRALCDDCIANELGLPNRNQAHQATSAFAVTPLFVRHHGMCDGCGKTKGVIETVEAAERPRRKGITT